MERKSWENRADTSFLSAGCTDGHHVCVLFPYAEAGKSGAVKGAGCGRIQQLLYDDHQ